MSKVNRFTACLLVVLALLSGSLTAGAVNGAVTYSGDAGEFIFQPGSEHSVTDLFPDFKDVMPGDVLSQTVLVRSNASDKVDVKIYLRALGAHEDSREFLSRLTLTVTAGESRLFTAPADQTAQLTDWVELGELASGGEVELTVTLQVPVSLDNRFMDAVGCLDWQFMVEELPAEQPEDPAQPIEPDEPDKPVDPDEPADPDRPADPDKPDAPKTGDNVNISLFGGMFVGSGLLLAALMWLLWKKKDKRSEK